MRWPIGLSRWDGHQCARTAQNLGGPLCQGIAGKDLDRFAAERIFKVLEPAALELSLDATEDIEKECQRLEQHWCQRLERARQQADRCERQFQAVEPGNRLVARTLEKNWEAALREQEKLNAEYEDFRRTRSATLTEEQRTLIRNLSQDLPELWNAPTTTPEDRQQIVRMLIDRIDLNIEGQSERAEITVTWAGGFSSHHQFEKAVTGYSQLSYLDELIARIIELKQTYADLHEVADQLNKEGYRPLRRGTFTNAMVSRLLRKRGIHSRPKRLPPTNVLRENEWWLGDLAKRLGMPKTSLNHWLNRGWLTGRKSSGLRGRRIVWADEAEVARLEQLRATRRRWSDCPFPPELTTPMSNPSNASKS
jgi:hypothetical protein